MQITEVRLRRINSENKMKAVASVTFDGAFVVHDIKVIERENKPLLVVMPSKRPPKGDYKDVAHPINQETREMISKAVLDKYASSLEEDNAEDVTEE